MTNPGLSASRLFSGKYSTEYELRYKTNGAEYVLINGVDLSIVIGKRTKLVREWFTANPPVVRFEQEASPRIIRYADPPAACFAIHPQRIQAGSGMAEPQPRVSDTPQGSPKNSIQYKVIQWLK